jgi:hypothetical protein
MLWGEIVFARNVGDRSSDFENANNSPLLKVL